MAVTDALATAAQYRTIVGKTDLGDDVQILTDLTAVSRTIERELGRFFTKDAAAVAREFRTPWSGGSPVVGWAESENPFVGSGWRRSIDVDDLAVAPTSVIVDEDGDGLFDDAPWTIDTHYVLRPLNADKGSEPRPWTVLEVPPWSVKGGFPPAARIQVTAVWGWPSVPAAIMEATCHLTGILRLETPRATSRVNELGEVLSTSTAARDILDRLQRVYRAPMAI